MSAHGPPRTQGSAEAIGGPLVQADVAAEQDIGAAIKASSEQSSSMTFFGRQSSWAISASLRASVFKQFGGSLQPFSPDPAKHTVTPKIDNKARSIVKGQPYCKLELIASRPNSRDRIARGLTQRDHIARVLTQPGCKPIKFTRRGGKPQLDENAVEALLADVRIVRGLGELLMLEKRLSQLVGGDGSLVRACGENNRVHRVLKPMGTTTSRATNFQPNLAQVRSANKPDGHRFRNCFKAYPGCVFVGADMDGLQGRGFGRNITSLDGRTYATA
jgi:hypothetical protein